ncbi:MAG: hypothetical protein ABI671_16065 [Burkholderiales bacterium]
MPTASLEGARAWRDANLNPAHRKDMNPARSPARPGSPEAAARTELQRLENLMCDGARAIAAGLFEYVANDLRAAMRAVPANARHCASLNPSVMDALTASACAPLSACEAAHDAVPGAAPMSDDEAADMGRFWYALAANEPMPAGAH